MNNADDIIPLLRGERDALRNIMPFFQTAPTAGGGGMLGDKYRVTSHRRLLAVVYGVSGRKPLFNKISGVLVNGFGTFVPAVPSFLLA